MHLAILCSPVCRGSTTTLLHLRKKVVEDAGDEARGHGKLRRGGEGSKHRMGLPRTCLAVGKDAGVVTFETAVHYGPSSSCSSALMSP